MNEIKKSEEKMLPPTYRIFTVPKELRRNLVNTRDNKIRDILFNPPVVRDLGFGFRGVHKIRPIQEGIKGDGIKGEQEIVLLDNGYLELRSPLENSLFQWRRTESGFHDTNWLYPYAVCELPVTFLMLAKQIYAMSKVSSSIVVKQEYWNVNGFVLMPGHPANPFFMSFDGAKYKRENIIGKQMELALDFEPDNVAYQLVQEVYDYFGFGEKQIPLFDENKKFKP